MCLLCLLLTFAYDLFLEIHPLLSAKKTQEKIPKSGRAAGKAPKTSKGQGHKSESKSKYYKSSGDWHKENAS